MAGAWAMLFSLPHLASALRLRDEAKIGSEENFYNGVSIGATLGTDGIFRKAKGRVDAGNSTNASMTWPDSWMVAHEHGHFIAQLMDEETLFNLVHAKQIGGYSAMTAAIPQYNVPALKMHHATPGWEVLNDEGPRVTQFPSYLALAASWDKDLVYEVAYAVAEEFKTFGANVMLGPAVNIHRATQHDDEFDSLSGEDPTLGSVLVRSWILGTQTHGIMSVPKYIGKAEQLPVHFENASANVTSWDIFYPPFETAIDCGAAGVMCASHEVNGLWSCRDGEMLERDLKKIMGFHGMVMSDVGTAREYFNYKSSFESGLDLMLEEPEIIERTGHMIKGMRKAATRVIAAIWHMRFEMNPGCQPPDCYKQLASNASSAAHVEVAKKAAGSAITLLKNDGMLPLTRGTVAVFGPLAFKSGGKGFETVYHAVKAHAKDKGVKVVPSPAGADYCLVMASSNSGHSKWALDQETFDALNTALRVCPQTAVFMETSGAVLMPWRDQVSAIAQTFRAAEESAFGWAAMIFGGDQSPSGKLPIGFPDYGQDVPQWWTEAAPSYWDDVPFAYPFGHGLSYASFEYSDLKPRPACRFALCVQLTVTNKSPEFSGAEVVQVYFKFSAEVKHPTVLRAFHKTKVLAPGASELVFFPFTYRDLALYQDIGNSAEPERSWVEQEQVEVLVGSSSKDIRKRLVMYPKFG